MSREPTRGEMRHYVDTLAAGLRGLEALDRHATERAGIPELTPGVDVCRGCMRYGVEVGLRGKRPQDVINLRCPEAQLWQCDVWTAYWLLENLKREEAYRFDDDI